ncbi:nucleotidyltransferase family protein [Clostridium saccharoperbutylacetonicum]|uniref:nucleotidyltransferase family protein n=1 Tax=Clostridium saccharoperbutylacetonicum TaxID=36745 RepID=UPI000983E84D|nr:nucleotidyltransferase family protein [Clostridium saccharoperbutylacetonicum]AQR96987.1 D-glycero-alpha-D-manno-heptose 1-phosphate guanylyltransferase [Clostridium saccharoperbutylacetonicum]NSB32866.1 NDP-sugar pyrophosphorylase family protein [Clostridium saccharoperbutylacetonicum]
MDKRAIILAGGKGTRLRPYTVVLPKPLMPICEYPILEIIVRQLAFYGFNHITMAVNHQADIIKAYFGNGERWNVKIDYSLEKIPLSTVAPLKYIEDLPNNFLLMNGDILTDLNYDLFYKYHVDNNSLFTISSYTREQRSEYGVLDLNNENELVGFREKPITKYNVSMGIYMVNKEILKYIPSDTAYGFDNLMYDLLEYSKKVYVKKFEGYWLDIGRPDDYMQAIDEYDNMKEKFLK